VYEVTDNILEQVQFVFIEENTSPYYDGKFTQDSTPRNVNHINAYTCLFSVLNLLPHNLLLYVHYEIDEFTIFLQVYRTCYPAFLQH
jgi:hypothetical protein